MENNWIIEEAKGLRYTRDYGTFNKALLRCVEERILPILVKLILQLDANNNLMILHKSPSYKSLWISLLGSYFPVTADGKELSASSYDATFPFSFGIINDVEEKWNQSQNGICKSYLPVITDMKIN